MRLTLFLLLTFTFCNAQSDVPLTLRAQYNGSYGYTIIGNTHNEFDNWQNPPPLCQMLTQSNATLNLAANQTIVGVYLYWSGIGDGTDNPTVQLNGVNYTTNQVSVGYPENNFIASYFGAFRDITPQVIGTGNGIYTFQILI